MANNLDNGSVAPLTSDDIKNLIKQIASEVHIKDYEIVFKEQEFTGDNYCGEITRVQIKPVNNGKKALSLIVKKAPTGGSSRSLMPIHDVYVVEIFAYTNIIPAFYRLFDEFNIPSEDRFLTANFYKGLGEEFKEIIILKDLSDDGFVMSNKRTPFDFDHAALVLQNMASVHAGSFVMREKYPKQFSKLTDSIPKEANFGEPMMSMLENIARTYLHRIECPKNKAKLESFLGKTIERFYEKLDSSLSEPYNVMCHGDSWNNNMLFKYNKDNKVEQVVFIDWQIMRFASPLADVCYMFCMSTNQQLLESHLYQLLDIYYETLGLRMKDMGCDIEKSFPKKVFLEHFRNYMPFGLSMATGGLPIALSEPEDAKAIGDYEIEDGNIEVNDVPLGEVPFQRISGLVDYFVKHDLI